MTKLTTKRRAKTNKLPKKRKKKKDTLMEAWSECVKAKAGYKCESCGKTTGLNSHHIYSRRKLSTRYELDNGVCLCSGCHTMSSNFSAHKTPIDFIEWIKSVRGLEWYRELRWMSKTTTKLRPTDRQEKEKQLRELIGEYNT